MFLNLKQLEKQRSSSEIVQRVVSADLKDAPESNNLQLQNELRKVGNDNNYRDKKARYDLIKRSH